MKSVFLRTSLGNRAQAEAIAERASLEVPAYQQFLKRSGICGAVNFSTLPLTDKDTYVLAYPFTSLLAPMTESCTIGCSSGSSGNRYYWPQLQSSNRKAPLGLQMLLESNFAVHRRPTLAILGYILGGWNASDSMDWALKSMAATVTYPFFVFCPGKDLDAILAVITQMQDVVDQIVIFLTPSASGLLHLKAERLKQSLPLKKLRYVVTGEPFPETLRTTLPRHPQTPVTEPLAMSLYGSADTGLLGAESKASIALRTLLHRNPSLADELGFVAPIPHFFHVSAADTYFEIADRHLCITRWQGIPIVRYILFDRTELCAWQDLKRAVLASPSHAADAQPWLDILQQSSDRLPDILAVTGRADRCLTLNSHKLTEYTLDAMVRCAALADTLTGLYEASIIYEGARQRLAFTLELRENVVADANLHERIYTALINVLNQFDAAFFQSWSSLYKAWDDIPELRIIKLNLLPYPSLAEVSERTTKHRGIPKDTFLPR